MFDRDNWHILLKVYIFIKVVFFTLTVTLQHQQNLMSCGTSYQRRWKTSLKQCFPFLKKHLALKTQKTLRKSHPFWKPCFKIQHRQRKQQQRPFQRLPKNIKYQFFLHQLYRRKMTTKYQKYLLKGKDIYVLCCNFFLLCFNVS